MTTLKSRGIASITDAAPFKPLRALGEFSAFAIDTFVKMFTTRFAWRESLDQVWFLAKVATVPALVLSIPYVVMTVFTFNVLLLEIGAADQAGAGASLGVVNQIGPFVTVLVVAGAGASAICADLGSRTIRDELDALKVMGVDPVQALVVPRVVAATIVALLLSSWVTLIGLAGGFLFSVYVQGVTPGAFISSMTLITGMDDVVVSMVKATTFGLAAGLIACFQGTRAGGGPAGVGIAVNETVVYAFVSLFFINTIITVIGSEVTK